MCDVTAVGVIFVNQAWGKKHGLDVRALSEGTKTLTS